MGKQDVAESPLLSASPALKAKQQLYVLNMARGVTNAEACRRLGISERTGQRWQRAGWCQFGVEQEIERLRHDIIAALKPLFPKALATYEKHLDAGNYQAAEDVLNRIWGKPTQRIETYAVTDIHITFSPPAVSAVEARMYTEAVKFLSGGQEVIDGECKDVTTPTKEGSEAKAETR